jgi:predicted DNA-binding transcriptional regulator AlpA
MIMNTDTAASPMLANGGLPILLTAEAAAEQLGVSRTTFWKLHAQGRVPRPVRLSDRCVRWRSAELQAWAAAECPPRDQWRWDPKPNLN